MKFLGADGGNSPCKKKKRKKCLFTSHWPTETTKYREAEEARRCSLAGDNVGAQRSRAEDTHRSSTIGHTAIRRRPSRPPPTPGRQSPAFLSIHWGEASTATGRRPGARGPSQRPSVPTRADPCDASRVRPRPTDPPSFDRGSPASDPGAAARAEAEPMERSAASQLATATRRSLQPPSCPLSVLPGSHLPTPPNKGRTRVPPYFFLFASKNLKTETSFFFSLLLQHWMMLVLELLGALPCPQTEWYSRHLCLQQS